MRIKIKNTKARSVFFENSYYETGKEIDVPFSMGLRLSRMVGLDILDIEPKEYNPELFKEEKKFAFTSDLDQVSGWGNVTFNLLKHSKEYCISLVGRLNNVTDGDVLKMASREVNPEEAMIWHEQPKDTWEHSCFKRNIAIVPFETTVIPASWIARINKFEALFVPCQQNVEAFRNSGVKVPIEIIHWGVDTAKFKPIERPKRDTFTFGHMGALSVRKGTDVLIDAFREAFPPHLYPNVRLICKTSNYQYPFMVKDSRIKVMMTPVSHEDLMKDFFEKIDCFVFPTRGEGFGLTPLEAMATGVPSIVTGWSGPAEYMNEDVGWSIRYKESPAVNFTKYIYKEECGNWVDPDKEHLKEIMKYCYEHPDEVREKGKRAAEYVQNEWTWEKKIGMFKEVLNKYL